MLLLPLPPLPLEAVAVVVAAILPVAAALAFRPALAAAFF